MCQICKIRYAVVVPGCTCGCAKFSICLYCFNLNMSLIPDYIPVKQHRQYVLTKLIKKNEDK